MNEDQMTKECKIRNLQEVKLQKCGLALEASQVEAWARCPVEVTGITMVWVPESESEAVEEEIFHTPPEHLYEAGEKCDGDVGVEEVEVDLGKKGSDETKVIRSEDAQAAVECLKPRNVESSKGVGRRVLPNSFKEAEKNEGLWVPRWSFLDNATFKGLMEVVVVSGGASTSSTDKDYIKAAKERGLEFYRPRWWPTHDDQVVD